jgi:hypothetical protein
MSAAATDNAMTVGTAATAGIGAVLAQVVPEPFTGPVTVLTFAMAVVGLLALAIRTLDHLGGLWIERESKRLDLDRFKAAASAKLCPFTPNGECARESGYLEKLIHDSENHPAVAVDPEDEAKPTATPKPDA